MVDSTSRSGEVIRSWDDLISCAAVARWSLQLLTLSSLDEKRRREAVEVGRKAAEEMTESILRLQKLSGTEPTIRVDTGASVEGARIR